MDDAESARLDPAGLTNDARRLRRAIELVQMRVARLREHPETFQSDCVAVEASLDDLLRELETTQSRGIIREARDREDALAREQIARLTTELERIQQSIGWAVLQRARRLRARLFREGTVRGRAWKTAIRLAKWGLATSPRPLESKPGPGVVEYVRPRPAPGHDVQARPNASRGQAARALKVSVLVPNYNHEAYLEERLRSIFAQTRPADEIIFLDDASTDASVSVAQRMAAESPVSFQMVLNEENSGSTFKQWMKGFALATGDLIWIAESDDSCREQFLEEVTAAFDDDDVALAYSQSTVIGSLGEQYASDYLFNTDDISYVHWRSAYTVTGAEEVELALSQKNTIPNASAVVFRKPKTLDYADELTRLKLAGDWLFYAMQLRGRKIAFIPRSLNHHRRHAKTVRNAFEHTERLFEEQLMVKARIMESFAVSSHAISRSLGCTIREYNDLTRHLGLETPPLLDKPELAGPLGRIRRVLRSTLALPERPRVLIVVDSLQTRARHEAALRLANALVQRYQVYFCNTLQWLLCPRMAARLDERVVLLEGTLGVTPWAFGGDSDRGGTTFGAVPSGRAEVLEELIRFHEIDVIHSHGWWADRLVFTVNRGGGVPWFIDLSGDIPGYRDETDRDPDFGRLIGPMLSSAQAVFYADDKDLRILEDYELEQTCRSVQVFDGVDPRGIRAAGESIERRRQDHDFLCVLAPRAPADRGEAEAVATRAMRIVNALPGEERGHRLVRLIVPTIDRGSHPVAENAQGDPHHVIHDFDADFCDVAIQCDAGLFTGRSSSRAVNLAMAECLACGIPVVAHDGAVMAGSLIGNGYEGGVVIPTGGDDETAANRLAEAILGYLRNPESYAAHRAGARAIFERRFRIDHIAAKVAAAYAVGSGSVVRSRHAEWQPALARLRIA